MSNFDLNCDCGHTRAAHHNTDCDHCACGEYKLPKIELDPLDKFDFLLVELRELHNRKKSDYSNPKDRFSNFRIAGEYAGIPTEKTFEVLLGVKQARLIELNQPGREIKNESIEDTLMDRAVYSILALLYWRENK